ncbi:MAG: hypothetical protein ABR591_12715 [Candidatus Velthaea sp.]
MTDDELERALLALPLEEPPAGLHGRILAATIYRPRLTFRTWEIWAIGTALALMVWLTVLVLTGVPDAATRITHGVGYAVNHLSTAFSSAAMLWAVLGISSAIWLSQLSLPGPRRPTSDH